MTNVARLTGATTYWRNGFSGQGVDVALLDSGVLPGRGPDDAEQAGHRPGPVLRVAVRRHCATWTPSATAPTWPASSPAATAARRPATYATDTYRFVGMAPGSRIVSLKLADAQGNTDVSQVIAAIDWVVAARAATPA